MKFRKLLIALVSVLLLLIVILGVCLAAVEWQFSHYQHKRVFYDQCNKVWAHRGFVGKGIERNSLVSIKKAFESGSAGVEMDMFYDVAMDRYIISHNRPYSKKDGEILFLDQVFEQSAQSGYFWLDYKNLDELHGEVLAKAVMQLDRLLLKNENKNKVIIESTQAEQLSHFAKKDIHTSYWIMPNEKINNPLVFRILMTIYKMNISQNQFSAVSMNVEDIGDKVRDELSIIPWHLFVMNDLKQIEDFNKKPFVKIMLSDLNAFEALDCDVAEEVLP